MAAKPRSCPVIQASRGAWRPRVLSQIPATGASSWASLPFPLPRLRPQRPLFLFRYRARAVTCWNYWQGAGRADGQGRDHPVAAVLALAAAAVVAGMKGYTAISGWVADVPPPVLAGLYLRCGAAPARRRRRRQQGGQGRQER
jgi:hypothetical protein